MHLGTVCNDRPWTAGPQLRATKPAPLETSRCTSRRPLQTLHRARSFTPGGKGVKVSTELRLCSVIHLGTAIAEKTLTMTQHHHHHQQQHHYDHHLDFFFFYCVHLMKNLAKFFFLLYSTGIFFYGSISFVSSHFLFTHDFKLILPLQKIK